MSSSCLILRDSEVHNVLLHLSRDEIQQFKTKITNALVQFSTTEERKYQPDPAVVSRPDSGKTLFRTYTSPNGPGVKIVQHPHLLGGTGSTSTQSNSSAGIDNTTQRGASVTKTSEKKKPKPTLHGIIAACDEEGFPKAFMNSDTLTAYRTAMSAIVLYAGRKTTTQVVLFGAGKTAIWHVRLILALRGEEIEQITIINRSTENAQELVEQVQKENKEIWKSPAILRVLDTNGADFGRDLKEVLAAADVVFCTTGVRAPLFPAEDVAQQRECYISSIGSWQDDMVELDPVLLVEVEKRGVVVVDNREDCLENCGDLKRSGLVADQVREVGELMSKSDSSSAGDLREGLVVYKSVGVGITDLIAANFMVDLARKAGVGTTVADM